MGIFVERRLSSDLVLQNYHVPAGVSEAPRTLNRQPARGTFARGR